MTTKNNDFDIDTHWRAVKDGWEFEAVARAAVTRRVIARSTGHLGVDTQTNIESYLSVEAREIIEKSVYDACESLARNAPKKP